MKKFFNKKGYKYEKKDSTNVKREVLSYEEMPLDEVSEEEVKISKDAIKKILTLVAILLVLGLAVFAVANRDNLTPEKIQRWIKYDLFGSTDTGFPVEIIGTSIDYNNFGGDDGICYVSDTSFVSLSYTGNELGYDQISYSNPVLSLCGEKVLIYNLGGKGFAVGDVKGIANKFDTENDIYTADINNQGDYCVVTKTDGYLSKLIAYNSDNEQLYAYSFSEYYITNVAINENGDGCVAFGVSGSNGSLSTIAYVLDFSSDTPNATYSLDENLVYQAEYFNTNTICIVGSDSSYVLNIKTAELKEINYNKMQLTAFDIDTDTDNFIVSLSRTGDGRQCSLEYIDSKGEIISVNDTEYAVESIDLYKNRIVVLDNNVAYLFDTNKTQLGKADAGNGSKTIKLDSSSSAYVLGINEIRKIIEFDNE